MGECKTMKKIFTSKIITINNNSISFMNKKSFNEIKYVLIPKKYVKKHRDVLKNGVYITTDDVNELYDKEGIYDNSIVYDKGFYDHMIFKKPDKYVICVPYHLQNKYKNNEKVVISQIDEDEIYLNGNFVGKLNSRRNLKRHFMDMVRLNSVLNDELAELYFYAFMGAFFNKNLIYSGTSHMDLRFNVSIIQQSRTGKSRLNKVLKDVSDNIGIKCATVTSYTTAGLIGTIDTNAIEHNSKYENLGLSKENTPIFKEKRDGTLEEIHWKDPVIIGDMGNYDILIFDELRTLLNPTKQNEDILLTMQPALDYPPLVRKKLRHEEEIKYENPVTLIGTTFPFGSFDKTLSQQGFLQRTFLFIRNLDINHHKKLQRLKEQLKNKKIKKVYNILLNDFKQKLSIYSRERKQLTIDGEAKNYIEEVSNVFF